MDLRHLQTLVTLAEELNYGRAARRLHVVQSAVTRTIQDLEEDVGALLFRRSKRRVELTAAGEALVQRAREILGAADRAALECRRVAEGKSGRLRVAVSGLSGVGLLPEALRAFHRRSPDVEVEIVRQSSAAQLAELREGRIDLALTNVPLEDDEILIEQLVAERLCAILPEDHELARAKTIHADRILREVSVILSRSSEPEVHRAFSALARRHGAPKPRIIEVDDVGLMLPLVAAGLAISQLPEGAVRISYRGVVAIPIEPTFTVGLHAMLRKNDPSPQGAALLAELRLRARRPP
jgi:LysR family transcriptional regulator, benzoate and cis,cis-muconate-responsive activator of ben and cat genes